MADVGKLTDWLRGHDGIVALDLEGESPTRLRVEFATEMRAAQFVSTVPLIDGIKVSAISQCTIVIEDD
jgi:hypothetical protein